MSWWITPFHMRSDFHDVLTLDDKIQIFYERVTGWQLDIADKVINGIKDEKGKVIAEIIGAGFGALNIVLSYFEMIGKYKDGYVGAIYKGKLRDADSKKYFTNGINMVFPEFRKDYPWLPKKIYSNVRCGLYHHGLTEGDIILKGEGLPPLTIKGETVTINPHTLVTKLKAHFEEYMKDLRQDTDFQTNFEKRFNFDNGIQD